MSAVILVIDQLPVTLLGPYGNTTVETTNFNRLAAQSLLFDFAFADSVELVAAYQRLGFGAQVSAATPQPSRNLIQRLAKQGIDSILISDDPELAENPRLDFDRVISVAQTEPLQLAQQTADTQLAYFFAQATSWLSTELEPDQLVWLHSRGLSGGWDAPYSLRRQFAAEDDPDPPTFVQPPATWIDPSEIDPDQILGWQQSAAAQVVLIDEFLGVLLDVLEGSTVGRAALLALTSTRGCGLGEHGLVGSGFQLYGESIQVPLLIRFPDGSTGHERRFGRSGSLIQINFLAEFVESWLNEDHATVERILDRIDQVLPDKNSQAICLSSDEQDVLQTHAWKLIRSKMAGVQLFAKPDDRWEVNDISDRCPDVVEQMLQRLDQQLAGNSISLPDSLARRGN